MGEEITETTNLSVSLIVLAILLGFISVAMGIRSTAATARNDEVAAQHQLQEYRKFNRYNDVELNGDEVVELVTAFADSGVEIYLNTSDGASGAYRWNTTTIVANTELVDLAWLRKTFTSNKYYKAQLVYDGVETSSVIGGPMSSYTISDVTGISLQWLHN